MDYNKFLEIINETRNKRLIWFGLESEPKANDVTVCGMLLRCV